MVRPDRGRRTGRTNKRRRHPGRREMTSSDNTSSSVPTPTSYSFTTIDDPLGAHGTVVTGINDFGEIIGYYIDASFNTHGFILNNGVFTTIDDPNAAAA